MNIQDVKPGMVLADGREVKSVEVFSKETGGRDGGILDFTDGSWEAYWGFENVILGTLTLEEVCP